MFLSKIWVFLLAVFAGAAAAVTLSLPNVAVRELERSEAQRLDRTEHAAELLLKVNARVAIDAASQLASDAGIIDRLEAARGQLDEGAHRALLERLRFFNQSLKADLLVVTDAH